MSNQVTSSTFGIDQRSRFQYNVFPIRCFSCGYPIGCKQLSFEKEMTALEVRGGKSVGYIFEKLNIQRICCRRFFLAFYCG
jgi:DNA-directed RNA polymerase subunit N (RpoN/RPB10)